ncbi:hypothetical protein DTO164E3_6662 [Paecilomyces variotii]|nr:hypothetical protein DTO164E3_6662 [Paecilomyces variotii]
MVYSFTLPTTSHLSFQKFLSSSTHPSLPQAASTARHALRLALKAHKHLPRAQRETHLPTVLAALNNYLPYIFALSHGLSGKPIGNASSGGSGVGEEVEITLRAEIEVEWRPTLTSGSSILRGVGVYGGSTSRVLGRGLDFEIAFTLTTLGYVLSGIARSGVLRTLYAARTPTAEQRTAAVQTATKHLLQASAVHSFLASSPSFAALTTRKSSRGRDGDRESSTPSAPAGIVPDLHPATQAALATLALAEATLLAVLKDDAYVTTCIQARNPRDKDWMVRAPEIPKVRALLFARLCVRGAEYAEQVAAGLGTVGADGRNSAAAGKIDEDLVRYARTLGKVARARACRFFGVDAELSGKIGEGIAWLRAAKAVLGFKSSLAGDEEAATKSNKGGLARLKREWAERREEKKMEKEAGSGNTGEKGALEPGDDAGREEEGRVIDMLETKWVKMNDTANTQLIPAATGLLSNLPSGRDIHSPPAPYTPPALDEDDLVRMRAPPEEDEVFSDNDPDSDDETNPAGGKDTPGAFPGSRALSRAESTAYY